MLDSDQLIAIGRQLYARSGDNPMTVYDMRVDWPSLVAEPTPQAVELVAHQLLMRSYQGRYVLLPQRPVTGSIVQAMAARYDPAASLELDRHRPGLEAQLLTGDEQAARNAAHECSGITDYVAAMLARIAASDDGAFLGGLSDNAARTHAYRNFLIQSSADLLAEASASALGVIGEYGPPQSALFRVLIDEFGYGTHDKKHSVLFRRTIAGFGLDEEYNATWPLYDCVALGLHNTIHAMFQTPAKFFRQIGFLLLAETSYQKSTEAHYRHLRRFHPEVDATYFGEHAHIDVHHSRMLIDEVVGPLVDRCGDEAAVEIMIGAELTQAAFMQSDVHLAALTAAFGRAVDEGRAQWGLHPASEAAAFAGSLAVTPDMQATCAALTGMVQVGGLGWLVDPAAMADLPAGSVGRVLPW